MKRNAAAVVVGLTLLGGVAALAATPTLTRFTAGTTAKASEVNANFDALVGQITALEAQVAAMQAQAVPPGTILAFAGTTPPTGFLLCDGSAVGRTQYAALFAAIQIAYGGGDGVNTFNLPDLRGRAPVGAGQGTGLTGRPLAAAGGEEAHLLTSSESGLASHTHPDNGHTHVVSGNTGGPDEFGLNIYHDNPGTVDTVFVQATATTGNRWLNTAIFNGVLPHSHSVSLTSSLGNASIQSVTGNPATAAHNNMQPFLIVNFIIKT